MEYLFLAGACFFFSVQFVFQKLFQKYSDSSFAAAMWCALVNALFMIIFLLPNARELAGADATAFICSAVYSAVTVLMTLAMLIAMKGGKLSMVTSYMLLGGFILPFLWGVAVYREALVPLKIAGLALMLLCILAGALPDKKGEKKEKSQRPTASVYVACALLFLSNGAVSIATAASQKTENPLSSDAFLLLSLIEIAVLSLLLMLVYAAAGKIRGDAHSFKKTFVEIAAVPPMTGKLFAALLFYCALHSLCNGAGNIFSMNCAKTMDSSLQFPVISAVVIISGALLGRIFFKEPINKRDGAGLILATAGIVCFIAA